MLEVDERVRAKVEHGSPVCSAAGADDPGARLPRQLHGKRADATRSAVNQDGLAGLEPAVGEQSLPCRET